MPSADTPLTVRRATAADADAVAALFDLYRQFYEQPSDPARARAFVSARLAGGDSVLFVAELGASAGRADVVGFAQVYPTFTSVGTAPIWHLNDLFVRADRRRLGVGEALTRRVFEEARQAGAARVQLETEKTNAAARAMYESLGMKLGERFVKYSITLG